MDNPLSKIPDKAEKKKSVAIVTVSTQGWMFLSLLSWLFTGKSLEAWSLPVPKVSPAIKP